VIATAIHVRIPMEAQDIFATRQSSARQRKPA
jgi:hypothetical protein